MWTEKRPPAGYFTRKTAQAALDARLTDLRRGVGIAPRTGATFRDAAEAWYSHGTAEKGWKPSTARDYRSALNKHLIPKFGPMMIESITGADIEGWRSERMADKEEPLPLRTAVKMRVCSAARVSCLPRGRRRDDGLDRGTARSATSASHPLASGGTVRRAWAGSGRKPKHRESDFLTCPHCGGKLSLHMSMGGTEVDDDINASTSFVVLRDGTIRKLDDDHQRVALAEDTAALRRGQAVTVDGERGVITGIRNDRAHVYVRFGKHARKVDVDDVRIAP